MRYTYYPGCSLHSTSEEYDASTRAVFQKLGIELTEVPDWNCCGASSGHAENHTLADALPLRNLILAEKLGSDVIAPCAACYNLLKGVDHKARTGDAEIQKLNKKLEPLVGGSYAASIQVRHSLEVLAGGEALNNIRSGVVKHLGGVKIAAYYGCLLTRPPKVVSFEENPEQPHRLDDLIRATGAESVKWTHKADCCGASLAISRSDLVATLVGKIITAARRAGAEALVTACPLCQANLDTRQEESTDRGMPVLFFTELLGYALGLDGSNWFKRHMVDPTPVLTSPRGRSASQVM